LQTFITEFSTKKLIVFNSSRVKEESDGSLVLHYYSDRAGLEYIVIGIVKVKCKFFSAVVLIARLRGRLKFDISFAERSVFKMYKNFKFNRRPLLKSSMESMWT
jgi:Haem-NO-binding